MPLILMVLSPFLLNTAAWCEDIKHIEDKMEKVTKSKLSEILSERLNLPVETGVGIVSTILHTITETLVNGENVEIRGFGSFSVRYYEPYTGRNPKTGKKIKVEPKKLPFFKVGKELRESLNADSK